LEVKTRKSFSFGGSWKRERSRVEERVEREERKGRERRRRLEKGRERGPEMEKRCPESNQRLPFLSPFPRNAPTRKKNTRRLPPRAPRPSLPGLRANTRANWTRR
jgi:hypothetical protein